jgi:hypothetical protein
MCDFLQSFVILSPLSSNLPQHFIHNRLQSEWHVRFEVGHSPYGKGKGKAVPLQAWCGPEGSRKLRSPDYMTTAQDGG